MHRVYSNRLPGQRRIHIEINPTEIADLLADLGDEGPYDHPATDTLVDLLTAAHALFVEDEDDAHDAARTAARQTTGQQPKPPAAYSDGKGRAYCLACAAHPGAEVPLTIDSIDPQEACANCQRYVTDVARQTTGQDDTACAPWTADGRHGPTPDEVAAGFRAFAAPFKHPGPAVGQPAEAQATDRAAAVKAIRDFPFWDFGMDGVDPNDQYAEWVDALATAIVSRLAAVEDER